MAGQQQEEIETIRSRTIEVKLSDADVKRISEKAAAHGLTVGELIENFIGGGTGAEQGKGGYAEQRGKGESRRSKSGISRSGEADTGRPTAGNT